VNNSNLTDFNIDNKESIINIIHESLFSKFKLYSKKINGNIFELTFLVRYMESISINNITVEQWIDLKNKLKSYHARIKYTDYKEERNISSDKESIKKTLINTELYMTFIFEMVYDPGDKKDIKLCDGHILNRSMFIQNENELSGIIPNVYNEEVYGIIVPRICFNIIQIINNELFSNIKILNYDIERSRMILTFKRKDIQQLKPIGMSIVYYIISHEVFQELYQILKDIGLQLNIIQIQSGYRQHELKDGEYLNYNDNLSSQYVSIIFQLKMYKNYEGNK
jgi:hypothetical protein